MQAADCIVIDCSARSGKSIAEPLKNVFDEKLLHCWCFFFDSCLTRKGCGPILRGGFALFLSMRFLLFRCTDDRLLLDLSIPQVADF